MLEIGESDSSFVARIGAGTCPRTLVATFPAAVAMRAAKFSVEPLHAIATVNVALHALAVTLARSVRAAVFAGASANYRLVVTCHHVLAVTKRPIFAALAAKRRQAIFPVTVPRLMGRDKHVASLNVFCAIQRFRHDRISGVGAAGAGTTDFALVMHGKMQMRRGKRIA